MLPTGSKSNEIDAANERIIRLGQSDGSGFLGQRYPAVTRFDLEFLFRVGHGRRRLNLRHPIGQNLSHNIFFRADGAGINTILHRASKRDHADSKDGDADKYLVEGKRTCRSRPRPDSSRSHDWSIGVLERWSVENFIPPFLDSFITPLLITSPHIA